MNLVRVFFSKIWALFFEFWKKAGESSSPSPPPSSYAPAKEKYDGAFESDFK